MEIGIDRNGIICLKKVYNEISLVSDDGEELVIYMRDSGFEFEYEGDKYEAKEGVVLHHKKHSLSAEVINKAQPASPDVAGRKYHLTDATIQEREPDYGDMIRLAVSFVAEDTNNPDPPNDNIIREVVDRFSDMFVPSKAPEITVNIPEDVCTDKPTKGIYPRLFWLEERLETVDQAIIKRYDAGQPIPTDWIEERNQLIEWIQEESEE